VIGKQSINIPSITAIISKSVQFTDCNVSHEQLSRFNESEIDKRKICIYYMISILYKFDLIHLDLE